MKTAAFQAFVAVLAFSSLTFAADLPDSFERVSVPLPAWLAARPSRSPGTLAQMPFAEDHAQRFSETLRHLMSAEWQAAEELAAKIDYELYVVQNGDAEFIVLQERPGLDVGPTAVLSRAPARDLIVEAPHAAFEAGTREQAALLVSQVGARAAIIAGAHRCASQSPSPCSGRTIVCGETSEGDGRPYPDSDVAHNPQTLFQVAHQTLTDFYPSATIVSLHGMRRTDDTWLIVSDGSRQVRAVETEPTERLRTLLRAELGPPPARAVSCNSSDDTAFESRRLCGFTNVQARWTHASADICGASADDLPPGTGHSV
jgi:hypothetical protein